MNPNPNRAQPLSSGEPAEPLDLTAADVAPGDVPGDDQWLQLPQSSETPQERAAGGRQVLAAALTLLAVLWIAYCAWSAGRNLGGQPLSSPLVANWLAISASPLILLGLCWLIFGRTRRKEAERFTQSVIAMRTEARSLEALLAVLSERISDSRGELVTMAQQLMQLGDEVTGKLGGITQQFDSSSLKLKVQGEALDRAAESARNDVGILLSDLPRAEATARELAHQLESIGSRSAEQTALLGQQIDVLGEQSERAEQMIASATERLATRLAEVDAAGTFATSRVEGTEGALSATLNALLERTSATLEEIRGGIDVQSAAVGALVAQASAGIGKAGADAAETLGTNVERANRALDQLARRVAEQDGASQRMIAEIERGLTLIEERFTELAASGDERANRFLGTLTQARTDLDALGAEAGSQDQAISAIAERTAALRDTIDRLADDIREGVGKAIGEAQGGTDRLVETAASVRPDIAWIREAAVEAAERVQASGNSITEQKDRLTALLGEVGAGVDRSTRRVEELASAIVNARTEAGTLTAESGPAMVEALIQVKDAAARAAERAREAIESAIPASAGKLSEGIRAALEQVIREGIEDRLQQVDAVAARAVDSARGAADQLTQQMLSLGQSAAALEQHVEQTKSDEREKDSEAFARRVAVLIDSMHSAAIDVGKILADEIDDKAWGAYLKGNRGVFTSRAVRLIDGSQTRAVRAHYDTDVEFQRSVNRYVSDFEAMLRRVLAERDGGMLAVTLMSSDMGKLYAALAQAIERKR